ncbi:MAG TPA: winged helix-turn-helix domain-containing protein [Blastocatellia bacterium]|nr:winged helix-turn-helix domain-containing protein [Blastocatellia bacterium]
MGAQEAERESDCKQDIVFPPYLLDVVNERLLHTDRVIALRPKTLAALRYLAERPGLLMRKDEWFEAVWPDTYATDESLKDCVKEIRRALNDDPAKPVFIETAHRRGYRFIRPVTRNEAASRYKVGWEDRAADIFRPASFEGVIVEAGRRHEERQPARADICNSADAQAVPQCALYRSAFSQYSSLNCACSFA